MLQHFLRSRCFRSSAFGRLPTWQGIFQQTYFIALATLYLALFASVFMSSLDLAYYSFPTKAPNHAMQRTAPTVMRSFRVTSSSSLQPRAVSGAVADLVSR